ncbi:MAG: CDP-alcohol phosphatidyltransferase family protein [Candidatus Zixiibacteriota bacterium]|nr:MAG: CDP-alcohol phosphatidyltransferase family protein [candidate division Zixibacteria bacterium]
MPSPWFQIPNLISLSRIVLIPFVGYFLAQGDDRSTLVCAVLLIVAGVTDGLDGYLARRLNQVSRLGIALDPVADKIFAGALVVLLILYRDFPLWLAAAIVGRDLLILVAGLVLLRGKEMVVPSNITGKYTFFVIALLLGSYTINFQFGIWLTTLFTVVLLILSTAIYVRVFNRVRVGKAAPVFRDKPVYKFMRIGALVAGSAVFVYKLLLDLFWLRWLF